MGCVTQCMGDGDSKGYSAVCAEKPYGHVPIEKEECIGHVRKRLGKALRDLKQRLRSTKLADGKAIGGRGRLTDGLIDSLQNYYGMAIRDHPADITGAAKAIWASLCHRASSDAEPMHQFCPEGQDSWCKYQQIKAGKPGQYKHHDVIPKAVLEEVRPVYVRLAERQLLERCSRGATQNANEAFNRMIWHICPKESFCSAQTVRTAVYLSVMLFNSGYQEIRKLLDEMDCLPGTFTPAALEQWDIKKQYHGRRRSSEEEKRSRKRRRAKKKGFADAAMEREGCTYEAGAFGE